MILAYGHGSNPIVLIFGTLVVSGVLMMIRTAMRQAEGRYRYSRPAISARLPQPRNPKPPGSAGPPASPAPPPKSRPATDGEMVKMMLAANWALYGVVMNQPLASKVYRRMTDPQPGDFVMEITTIHHAIRNGEDLGLRIGRLIERNGSAPYTTWKVRMMDGGVIDWSNADFVALPDTFRTYEWASGADIR